MNKLLIVDDKEENTYMLQVLLEGHGYKVETANDGVEALKKARQAPPDLIISDILMPVMDGFILCREWKKDDVLKSIPFIFYTATYTDPKDEEFALSLGAERFIVKPLNPDAFNAIVQEVIKETGAGRLGKPEKLIQLDLEEPVCMKEYSERLVKKLEDKMLELEESKAALERDIAERKRVETALRRSEERFRTCVENLNEGLAILSSVRASDGHIIDFRFEYINEAGCKMNHKAREEHMGKTLLELFPKQKKTGLFDDCVKALNTRQPVAKEYVLYEPVYGGGERLKQGFSYQIAGLGDGFVGTWQDILEKKRREESLKLSEERLKRLVENSKDVIVMTDLKGMILYYSGPPEFGVASEDLLSKTPFEILEPLTAARLMSQLKRVIRGKEALTIENLIPWKGESFWFSTHMYPIQDGKGSMAAVGIIARNITEVKRMEENLMRLEQSLSAHMHNSPLAIVEFDPQFRVIRWSQEAERVFGWTSEEILGKSIAEMPWVYVEDEELVRRESAALLSGERSRSRNVNRNYRKDGSVITCEWCNSGIYDSDGRLISVLSVVLDITERKRTEEALLKARDEREKNERVKN